MKVKILNPEQIKDLFFWWGKASQVCYNTQTDTPSSIGKHCMKSGHFSGSRSQYILFQIEECPRFLTDQVVRHEVGVMKNVQSFRYVDKSCFSYEVPSEIIDNRSLLEKYINHMTNTVNLYVDIQSYVSDKTGSPEKANEQARYLLPMSTHTTFVVGMDIEALIHFCNSRLCVRAEDTHRELASKMKNLVLEILPELKEKLVPNCQANLWCPEKNSCGAFPQKESILQLLKDKGIKIND